MIGNTISHYKILEKLGEGGMGVVYKAEDTKLKREVALKFLPRQIAAQPEEHERLKLEAQAAAALNHPNIATIYEIDEAKDETFIAMEYIDGQKLKEKIDADPLPLDTAIDIAIQVAEGLKTAHKKGVVHRDVKSANIMLTEEGQVKILDFGLAKVMGSAQLTKTGTIMGTVAYMSPEQARGERVDHRTDIWSFGVMLYEMISGILPYKGDYEQAVVYSILNEEPEPLINLRSDVPEELQHVVQKAMQKDTGMRFKDMDELHTEMLSIKKKLRVKKAEAAAEEKKGDPSIAVLPFVNMSPDPENEYFSDGMTEEIINALAQLKDLRVAARTSSFAFKGKSMDIGEVGAKLKVNTVLEGSVRKAGNKIRITAQLVNVTDGYHLWSERYDREMDDVFAIQDEIAQAIAGRLKVTLVGGTDEPLVKPPTDNVEAYDLYLKGRFFVNQKGEGCLKALEHFQHALDLDPQYALAHAGVADAYNFLRDMGHLHPKEAMLKTKQAAMRALEIDEAISEAHIALGWVSFTYEFDWPNAEKHFLRAIELNPLSAEAHSRYAFYLFHIKGQIDESITEARRGVELDPLAEAQHTWLGIILNYAGRFAEAVSQLRTAVELDPTSWHAHHGLGQAYRLKGMYPEAIAATQTTIDLAGRHPWSLLVLGQIYAATGAMGQVDTIYNELLTRSRHEYIQPVPLAILSAALGRKEEAFGHLDRAYEERDALLIVLKYYSGWDPLYGDPRFDALLKKIGLEE